eukprot:Gregarina_sp_Poly_1__1194@NODE_1293_length_4467_cov_891_345227_g874_i0_p2_GENE_NODE_1293_length_4467_cov_891_345227_g874_i0NODE_1293_length_4467_cov_891_345227_g874_i0_p2_ORF_typecomplete_len338_score32_86_NODE_1293_length_4467_cov_891_345227_g874_i015232536
MAYLIPPIDAQSTKKCLPHVFPTNRSFFAQSSPKLWLPASTLGLGKFGHRPNISATANLYSYKNSLHRMKMPALLPFLNVCLTITQLASSIRKRKYLSAAMAKSTPRFKSVLESPYQLRLGPHLNTDASAILLSRIFELIQALQRALPVLNERELFGTCFQAFPPQHEGNISNTEAVFVLTPKSCGPLANYACLAAAYQQIPCYLNAMSTNIRHDIVCQQIANYMKGPIGLNNTKSLKLAIEERMRLLSDANQMLAINPGYQVDSVVQKHTAIISFIKTLPAANSNYTFVRVREVDWAALTNLPDANLKKIPMTPAVGMEPKRRRKSKKAKNQSIIA